MTRSLPLTLLCASFAVAALAGCSNDPELRNQLTPELRNADYPPLLPIEDLVPLQPAPEQQSTQLEQNLNARSNTLQRRADALRRATN
ncbi:hypothetical protein [Pseudophaeobacter sp.]|jgi:outer membrane murein-binding lipoprotein Lpp|uniref:hypothetical protein n=1 Tax=unclassified Pseudophaeobacter TaxID=2637024 RepID=UPI0022066276|nr:hypothetical protein [uncultured Pseudophaeobacter sp.]UWS80950.1 hypothetical protein N1037_08045 [Phaeobacter sp. G2]